MVTKDPATTSVEVHVTVSNTTPEGMTPPAGTVPIPITVEVVMSPPITLNKPATLQINLTQGDLTLAGGDIHNVAVGVITPSGVQLLLVTVIDADAGIIAVTVDHFSKFTLFAVTTPRPTFMDPPAKSPLTGLSALLTWTNPPGTTQYQLQVIPFNNDGPGIDFVRGVETSYFIKAPDFGAAEGNYVMLPDMTYVWRVRTTSVTSPPAEKDWSAWSVSTFHTGKAPTDVVERVSPQAQETVDSLTPTLQWTNADKTVFYYEVQVSKDPNFGTNAFLYWERRHGGVTTPPNSYTIPAQFPLEAGTIYYWRVRPRIQGDGVALPWLQTYMFKTQDRPQLAHYAGE